MVDVSIIIVNYNTFRLTSNCISSIWEKTSGLSFEIIVVDNASTDDSRISFEKDDRIIYIYSEENLGFGRANNLGAKIARGRNLFLLNPDTLLINNAVKILSDYLDANIDVGVCGGNLYDEKMNPVHSYCMFLPSIFWEMNKLCGGYIEKLRWGKNAQFNYSYQPCKVGYICGANMMIKHSLFEKMNGFSHKFFLYYEDTELSYRIKKIGYHIVSIPYAKIQHLEGKSMGGKKFNPTRMLYIEQSLSQYYKLHGNKLTKSLVKPIRLVCLLLKYYVRYPSSFSRKLYILCRNIILEV